MSTPFFSQNWNAQSVIKDCLRHVMCRPKIAMQHSNRQTIFGLFSMFALIFVFPFWLRDSYEPKFNQCGILAVLLLLLYAFMHHRQTSEKNIRQMRKLWSNLCMSSKFSLLSDGESKLLVRIFIDEACFCARRGI